MAQVTMQLIRELRERTQAGLNDCKSALKEADGSIEGAIEVILKRGLAKSAKRAGKVAAEGEVRALLSEDCRAGVIVEVNIQTDFAARNEDFKAFVGQVAEAASQAADGADLGTLPCPGSDETIETKRQALVAKLGENITLRRWERQQITAQAPKRGFQEGHQGAGGIGRVHSYIHSGGSLGVLVAVYMAGDCTADPAFVQFLDETAMQIAALDPLYVHREDVPEALQEKQREIYRAQVAAMPKPPPEGARGKIVEGKLEKWLKEVVLLEQQSLLHPEHTLSDLSQQVGAQLGVPLLVDAFVRYKCGEGLQQEEKQSFAAEVAAMAQS